MLAGLLAAVSASAEPADRVAAGGVSLRHIGDWEFEPRAEFLGARIGGLSGIDYEPAWNDRGMLVVISDDPGRHGPARAYLGEIEVADDRIVGLDWSYLLRLTWATGERMAGNGLDPEGIRIAMHEGFFGEPSLIWVSEGRADVASGPERGAPRIYEMCSAATRMDEWPAHETHVPTSSGRGAKGNRGFESIALMTRQTAIVGTEEPLRQDARDDGRFVRLSTYSFEEPMTGPIAQVAYPLDEAPPVGVHGLVELLGLENGRLLALERSGTPLGSFGAKLYLIDLAEATDTLGEASLAGAAFTPATKTLVADLGELLPSVGNIEGLCFGPTLDDGTATLLLVSDSNFAAGVPTVISALAIEDDGGAIRRAPLSQISDAE
ncbi:MAG: esterase-like activity of phytase family protein [Planctomycetota bacterium]